jgi:hypothetical protein
MRASRLAFGVALFSGVTLGFLASFSPLADASRNSAGTYSLPNSPVTPGSTITSTWANSTLTDISTELTNSLDRSGRGAMLAPLQLSSGTSSAPSLTFGTDPDTGLYRAGAADVRMQVDATQSQKWTGTGTSVPGTLYVGGALTADAGVASTGGVVSTGAAPSGHGVYGIGGAPNGAGVVAEGDGTGFGVHGTGGDSSGPGVKGLGGAPNGTGVEGYGTGTGLGGYFAAGTAATSGTRRDAVSVTNGDVNLSGVVDPASTTAVSDRVTPKNVVKAWARLTTLGSGSTGVTVADGFNVTSAAVGGAGLTVTVTVASAFSSTNYAVFVTPGGNNLACEANPTSTTVITVACRNIGGGTVPFSNYNFQSSLSVTLNVMAIGAQ